MEKSEKDWQAEDDFNTLLRADEIREDSARLKRALKAGEDKKMDVEATLKRINGLRGE